MIKICIEKHNEILNESHHMEVQKLITLGFMGMAMTNKVLKAISRHDEFSILDDFYLFISNGLKKFLFCGTIGDEKFARGEELCDSLIPALEEFDYDNCSDKKDEYIMGLSYELIENWYYFTGMLTENTEHAGCRKFVQFLSVPLKCIDTFLCNKYSGIGKYGDIQERVNLDPLIQNEIKIINSDLEFVETEYDLSNIESRIMNYLEHDILT